MWAAAALCSAGAVWFLLMATVPTVFPWTPQFAWCFLVGLVAARIAGSARDDDAYYHTDGELPIAGSVTHVSLDYDAGGDD